MREDSWHHVCNSGFPGKGACTLKPPCITYIAAAGLLLVCSTGARSQNVSAAQALAIEVKPVTRIIVSGAPLPLVVSPGAGTSSATDGTSTYSLVTNIKSMRIVASIDSPMPPGTSLAITLESSEGVSRGEVEIGGSTEVVAGLGPGIEKDQRITYRFSALPGVTELASGERTVTLTLTD